MSSDNTPAGSNESNVPLPDVVQIQVELDAASADRLERVCAERSLDTRTAVLQGLGLLDLADSDHDMIRRPKAPGLPDELMSVA
jgi:hypothetical protein